MFPEVRALNYNEITIQLSLDGFSYAIYDKVHHNFVHLVNTKFSRPSLKTVVNDIEAENSCKISDFSRFVVLFDNCNSTFVPMSITQNPVKNSIVEFLGIGRKNSTIASDKLSIIRANSLYTISNEDVAVLTEYQSNMQFCHATSVLVASLVKDNSHRTDETIINVNVNTKKMDIIVSRGATLLFHNVFNYKTKEDFLYYILFVINQMHLDTNNVPLYFLGIIEEKSPLAEFTSRYIRDMRFVRYNSNIRFIEELEDTPYYKNYQLLNSITCEL